MPFMELQPDVIKDRFSLVSGAQHLCTAFLTAAFQSQEDDESQKEITLTFNRDEVILMSTLLHQLSQQVNGKSS